MFQQKQITLPALTKSHIFETELLSSQNKQKFLKEAFRTRSQMNYIGKSDHYKIIQQQELKKKTRLPNFNNQDNLNQDSTKNESIHRNYKDIEAFQLLQNKVSTIIFCFNIVRNKESESKNILRPTDAVSALVRLDKLHQIQIFQQEYQKRKVAQILAFQARVQMMIFKRKLDEEYDEKLLKMAGKQLTNVENQVNDVILNKEKKRKRMAEQLFNQNQ